MLGAVTGAQPAGAASSGHDTTVYVKRVEVVELPPLAAYYVSRLPPSTIFYDARTSG